MTDTQADVANAGIPTKACIACRQAILADATLCVHCKSDQSPWRNELRYWAGVAGVLTLIASGLAFTTNLGFQIWQRIFGHELAITNLDPFGKTVVWNVTRNPIYLRTINITSDSPKNDLAWEVHQTIPANKEIDIQLIKIAQEAWYGLPGEMFGRTPAEYAQLDPNTFEEVKQNRLTDKYVPTFLMPDSESYTQLKRNLRQFQTFECKASIKFVRLSDGSTGSVSVPCKGVFRFRGSTASGQ